MSVVSNDLLGGCRKFPKSRLVWGRGKVEDFVRDRIGELLGSTEGELGLSYATGRSTIYLRSYRVVAVPLDVHSTSWFATAISATRSGLGDVVGSFFFAPTVSFARFGNQTPWGRQWRAALRMGGRVRCTRCLYLFLKDLTVLP